MCIEKYTGEGDTLLKRWCMLALPAFMIVMDRVVCVLLCKAKAVIEKFLKFETKTVWRFQFDLENLSLMHV